MSYKSSVSKFISLVVVLTQMMAAISGVLPTQVAAAAAPVAPALAQAPQGMNAVASSVRSPQDVLTQQTEMRKAAPRTAGGTAPELARPAAVEAVAAAPLAANTASLTGIVYQDYNANGVRDTSGAVIDKGVGGVTIKAYDASGAVVGTATSFAVVCLGANNPAGQGCTAANTPARGSYTLSALPASTALRVEFSTLPTGYYPAPVGTNNATSVRFVTTTTGATSGLDFGVLLPLDYSQASPNLVTPLYVNGDTNTTAPTAALVKFAYSSSGTSPAPTTLATKAQIGSTWGLAYARSTKLLYVAAFLKRHAGLGPNGPGAIYAINTAGGAPTLFADLTALGANVGTVLSNSARGLGAPTASSNDPATFDQIGKAGLGDLDISDDERTLYVVNLNDKALYALNVPAGTLAGSYAIPDPGCTGGAWRPFALKFKNGAVYVGGVCDAQTSQNRADLKAYIYRFTPGANTFTQVLTFPLNYGKGPATGPCCALAFSGWYPWLGAFDTTLINTSVQAGIIAVYPQPMLSDIEFDVDGSLILGFMDRFGHQGGDQSYGTSGTTRYDALVGGDILRACPNAAGNWVLEAGGACGGVTGGGANGQGPGGGEFYSGEYYSISSFETSMGGLALMPGSGEVALTVMDPLAYITGGVSWLSNTTGGANRRYQVYDATRYVHFGKANGLGDLELLVDPAPIEIGNRVWNDANGNGVQDPGEAGISGVVVNLVTITGTVVAAATTDTNGNYYFSSATGTNTNSAKYGLAINPNTAYQVQIANATGASQQTALAGMLLTTANADSATNNDAITDVRDSDGVISGTLAVINYMTGGPGANNHGLDFGFYTYGTIQVVKQTFGSDGTFTFSSTDSSFNHLSLTTSNGIASSTVFTKPIGSYVVTENAQANWNLVGLWCSGDTDNGSTFSIANRQATLDLDKGENLVCTFANSTTPPQPTGTGVLTVTKSVNWNSNTPDPTKTFNINITGPSYPSGKADTITAGATNVYTGLVGGVYTVTEISPGAGWVTTYSVPSGVVSLATPVATTTAGAISGNVFQDFNADGVDAGTSEPGVAGVLVVAYDPNGLVVGADTTDASGNYSFTPIKPGPYRMELQSISSGYYVTKHGAGNGTGTQFVTANGGATNVNFGVNAPADYSQSNPNLVTNLYVNGNSSNATAPIAAIVSFPYNASGTSPVASQTTLATKVQVGSTFGLAYDRSTKIIYASAFLKRHVGLGPNGPGAIYAIPTTGSTPVLFADLAALGANVGTVPSNGARGLGAPNAPNADTVTTAPDQVGGKGLGDLDISDDGRTLYVTSLNDQKLYALNVPGPGGAPTLAGSYAIPSPCNVTKGVARPFGLKYKNGSVYVGGVCDAEISQNASDLSAYVYRFDGAGFTQIFTMPLNYARGTAHANCGQPATWRPWNNNLPICGNAAGYSLVNNPQPILSDIEFDMDGSLILGFMDRSAHETAMPGTEAGVNLMSLTAGDMVRACNITGNLVAEGGAGCPYHYTGVSGNEYYWDSRPDNRFQEIMVGGLALLPGRGEVVSTATDPASGDSLGVVHSNNSTGAINSVYNVLLSTNYQSTFTKGDGIGDLELLLDPAPLEIGNRVWKDLNGNGVQDPGEPGIANVTVALQSPTHTVTTNTDANGLYYFSVSPNTAYTLTINPSQAALSGLSLTQANMQAVSGSTTSNDPLLDTRDSDAVLTSGKATIFYTTGSAGQNNHGLDFGWTQPQFAGSVTLYNTAPQVGTIVIRKATLPAGSGQTFNFISNVPGHASFTLSDGGAYTMTEVLVGTYVVTETSPSGWTQANATCTSGSVLGAIQVQWNSTTTCNVFNAVSPTPPTTALTVTKTVNWNGNTPDPTKAFAITITGPSFPSGKADTITAGATNVYTNVVAGVYTVTETSPGAGWVTTYSVPSGAVNLATPIAATTAGPISGKVYQDFNSNGQIDSSGTVIDVGLPGLAVAAYDPNGVLVGTATTDASGNYSFTPTKPGPYRVELQSAPSGYYPTTHGPQNGTSTQFVTTNGGASNVNFGVLAPCDYCQNNPRFATVIQHTGDTRTSTLDALVTDDYATGTSKQVLTQYSATGTLWGLAYDRTRKTLYSGAYLQTHLGLQENMGATNPLGAIYQTNAATGATSLFVDISTLGANVGTIPSNATRGVNTQPSLDTQAFTKTMKVGLGDIDISQDDKTLYAMSLNDKTLYAINTATKQLTGQYSLAGLGNCTGGAFRPFAIGINGDKVYVGGVCDAEVSRNANDLQAQVYLLTGNSFTPVLTIPLNYVKGTNDTRVACANKWYPWITNMAQVTCLDTTGTTVAQASPALVDINFDVDGSMILGFRDRTGDQFAANNFAPNNTAKSVIIGGDLLKACWSGTAYVLENNGQCGGLTTSGANNHQGPGGGEFYAGDTSQTYNQENSQGGAAVLPGSNKVAVATMDPKFTFSGGVTWYSNSTGAGGNDATYYLGGLGKGNGIGDLELLCDPAPLEIGNRVWQDLNGNGVQDAGEPGINGVTVQAQGANGTISTTVTSGDGNYYFSNLRPNTAYTITINPSQAALSGLTLTQANMQAVSGSASSNDPILDTRDSDAVTANGKAAIFYTTGDAGQNNHGLDFGWTQPQFAGSVTLYNTAPKVGTIVIHKATLPAGSGQTFNFISNVPGYASFTLSDGDVYTMTAVPIGSYAVTETVLNGWTQVKLACTSGSTLGAIQVQWNSTTTCSVVNALQPTSSSVLTVTKTLSGTASGPFNITVTGPSGYISTTTINGGQSKVFTGLVNGVYTVTETSPGAGWTTVYTATTSTGSGSTSSPTNAVVTLQNSNTATLAATPINGKVFRDFNSDGLITANGVTTDTGVSGVTVTAYDKNGNVVGSATSAANGAYTINPTAAGPYRVVFSNLPAGYEPTTHGSQNGASTQFVTTAAQATGVNLGVLVPDDYSSSTLNLATTMFVNGDRNNNNNVPVFMAYPFSNLPLDNTPPLDTSVGEQQLGVAQNLGSVWGVAYDRDAHIIYTSAFLKRHADLGPQGIAGLYWARSNGSSVGSSGSINLNTLTSNAFGADPRSDGVGPDDNLNGVTRDASVGGSRDRDVYPLVGKVGIGDIDISPDGKTLYVMNLTTRKVEVFNVANVRAGGNPTYIGGYSMTNPGCAGSNTDWRPFALKALGGGKLYVGVTCTAESITNEDLTFSSDATRFHNSVLNTGEDANGNGRLDGQHDIAVYVMALNTSGAGSLSVVPISSITPALPAGLPAPAPNSVPLYYYRSCYASDTFGSSPTYRCPQRRMLFRNWIGNVWPSTAFMNSVRTIYMAQPLLSDIEVDPRDGSLVLGIMDRTGHQFGNANLSIDTTDNKTYSVVTGGELLRVCNTSGNRFAPTFVVEGGVGCSVTAAGNTSPIVTATSAHSYLGIAGDAEFYKGDTEINTRDLLNGTIYPNNDHNETFSGGVAMQAGSGQLVMTAMDAGSFANSGGLAWLGANGNKLQGRTVYPNSSIPYYSTFSKAHGMGDVELLTDLPPLEIGNRVWNDLNGNGIQDPGEPGLNGLTVNLVNASGTGISNTVTSGDGNYYFGNLQTNTAYTITLTPPSGYNLTQANAAALIGGSATSNHTISDTIDSDAALVNGKATIFYTTGSAGQNNHGLDFGFTQPVSGQVGIINTAPGVIQVTKQVVTTDGSEPTVSGSFTITVNCGGASVSPSNSQSVEAGSTATFSVPAGATCTLSEATNNLPAAPSGYSWVNAQVNPSGVTIAASVTATVTAKNTLAPQPTTSNVLTVTKTVNWNGNAPNPGQTFNITITGPSFPGGKADTITAGATKVYTNVVAGVYTVTETSPGAGWVTTYSVPSGVVSMVTPVAATTAGPISGNVFRDYNADGVDAGTSEPGVGGVTVTAYDPNGVARGSATTDASGNYSFTPTGSGPYRLELTNLPVGYYPTKHGTGNGTSTQFVTTNGGASNVNFGIIDPTFYSPASQQLATSIYINGSSTGTANTVARWDYANTGASPAPTQLASKAQVGATYGLAYARTSKVLYEAAFIKRHVGVGPNGIGAIYQIGNANGATPGTPSLFVDVASLGIDVGGGASANSPGFPSDAVRGLGGTSTMSVDATVFDYPGKRGLGDLDISDDERTLFVVNLFNQSLLAMPTVNPTAANVRATPIPDPGCVGGSARPFGLKYYHSHLYIGVVCDASVSLQRADLKAVVYRYDPANTAAGFVTVLTVPLTYTKGYAENNGSCMGVSTHWNPWLSTYSPCSFNAGNNADYHEQPEPILSDIEFDLDGSMILGFRDRLGDKIGSVNSAPIATTHNELTLTGGDILRAAPNTNGSYTLETNGSVASGFGGVLSSGHATSDATTQGPGGREFYNDNMDTFSVEETASGGLALLPGSGEVVVTIFDATAYNEGGILKLSNTNGGQRSNYRLFAGTNASNGYFGKANGLGDLELLVDPAPLEIGNRVWKDLNGNGVQDPGEPGLANVAVSLQSPNNTVTTNTDANGLYYFTVSPNTAYTLTINPSQAVLSGLSLTLANMPAISGSPSSNDAILDTRDSDAVTVNGKAAIFYTTGLAGQNNHGLDFGWAPALTGKVTINNKAPHTDWGDDPDQYDTTITNTGAAHIIIPGLFLGASEDSEVDGQPSTGANGDGADEDGVQFPSLKAGSTAVLTVTATNTGTTAATIYGWIDFNGDGQFTASERVTTTVPAGTTNGVFHLTYSVPANAVPHTYSRFRLSTDPAAAQPTGVALDGEVEDYPLTIQAMAQFGDRVWLESDADGLAATGVITPVQGLVITATAGAHVYTTTTNSAGYYSFSVPAGTYQVTYGVVPASYGPLTPSRTPGGASESGNAGFYAETGQPDQSHANGTTVTVSDGEANWHVDFAFHAPYADLRLVKQVDKTAVQTGDTVVYTLVLTNNGPDAAANVQVKDLLPAKETYQSANPQQGAYNPNTGIWDVGTVPANSSITITITVTVK
ncbi:MAG: SdrD B-like domain-containing protein [Caldilineaceae bacterium]